MNIQWNKHKYGLMLAAILLIAGTFLRYWNFGDWLHFELDQARDAIAVSDALQNGPGNLPLLGPKAAGTMLRLGPAFYYMQYLSGLVFGNSPAGMAAIFVLFSLGTIFLAYALLARYFGRMAGLMGALFATFSAFLVIYSRFAWNPNTIPFFVLLSFYGLLRATEEDARHWNRWMLLAFGSAAIASQLHFLVFVTLIPIMIMFLIIRRPGIQWKTYFFAILIVGFLYSPVAINELKTGGANSKEFYKAIFKNSQKDSKHTLAEKVVKSYTEMARGTGLLVFGEENADFYTIKIPASVDGYFVCNQKCSTRIVWGWAYVLFFTVGLFAAIARFFLEKDKKKKAFFQLFGMWTGAIFVLFIPLSFDLSPRFFLLLAPVVIVLIGGIYEITNKNKYISILPLVIFMIAVATNMQTLFQRFAQLEAAPREAVKIDSDRFLREKTRVTLEQELLVAQYMMDAHAKNGEVIYLNSDPQYRRALLYHIRAKKIRYEDLRTVKTYAKGNYFLVYPTESDLSDATDNYTDRFDIAQTKQFGTLTLFRLNPKPEAIEAERQEFVQAPESMFYLKGSPVRFTWNEIFSKKSMAEEESDDEQSGE